MQFDLFCWLESAAIYAIGTKKNAINEQFFNAPKMMRFGD